MPTKSQQHSIARIKQEVEFIQQIAPIEMKRISRQRKKQMEKSYSDLSLHGHKLGIQVPRLSVLYNPKQYLEHANKVLDDVHKMYPEKSIEEYPLNGTRSFQIITEE